VFTPAAVSHDMREGDADVPKVDAWKYPSDLQSGEESMAASISSMVQFSGAGR